VAQVALGHRRPLRPEVGHGRGDDRSGEVLERHVAQGEQVAQRRAELVGRRFAHGREAPVLDKPVLREGPQVRLGVADVDDEEHGARR
jgi:hypothetical protein